MPAAVVVIDLTVPSLVSEIGPIVRVEGWSRLETGAVTLQDQDAVICALQKIPGNGKELIAEPQGSDQAQDCVGEPPRSGVDQDLFDDAEIVVLRTANAVCDQSGS